MNLGKKSPEFFIGLPVRKALVRTGYCEPPEGDLHNSVAVNIDESCITCPFLACHMFRAILDDHGRIVAREFQPHPPEY